MVNLKKTVFLQWQYGGDPLGGNSTCNFERERAKPFMRKAAEKLVNSAQKTFTDVTNICPDYKLSKTINSY